MILKPPCYINQSCEQAAILDLFLENSTFIGFPKMGYPLRLFLAITASLTSLNTTKACPLILLFFLQTIWVIWPQASNSKYSAYLRSLDLIFQFMLWMQRVYLGCWVWAVYFELTRDCQVQSQRIIFCGYQGKGLVDGFWY